MSLTQTLTQLATNVQRTADVQGTSALVRHPLTTAIYDAVNRGIGALYRVLTETIPDQRFLSSSTVTIVANTATYALSATFDRLISVDITSNGVKTWLTAYEMPERPALTDTNTSQPITPHSYRLRGSNIEFLPTPATSGTATVWYVPNSSQLTTGSDTIDTIARLDDYVIWYGAREIATKDSKWQLIASLEQRMARLEAEIRVFARNRDLNSPPRIINTRVRTRAGRGPWRR